MTSKEQEQEMENPNLFNQDQHPLLNLLLKKEKIGLSQAQIIQENYQKSKIPITSLVCKLGLISENALIQLLAQEEDLETINLNGIKIPEELINLIPQKDLKEYQLIPIEKLENQLTLVMSDPHHFQAIQRVISLTKCRIKIVLATPSSISNKLDEFFKNKILQKSSEKDFFKEATKNRDLFTKHDLDSPKILLVAEMLQKFKEEQFNFSVTQLELIKDLNENALPILIQALKDENISVRIGSAWLLSELGLKAKPAVSSLIQSLNHADNELRSYAALALSKIGPGIPEAVPALRKALSDRYPKVQRIAAEALEKITGERISFKEKFSLTEKQPRMDFPSRQVEEKNDQEISFTNIFETTEKEQTPFVSGTYRGISRKSNHNNTRYYLGILFLILFIFLGFIFIHQKNAFLKDPKKGIEEINLNAYIEDPTSEPSNVNVTEHFEENLPWIDKSIQSQQEEKRLRLITYHILRETREGKFDKNIALLEKAKEKWEEAKKESLVEPSISDEETRHISIWIEDEKKERQKEKEHQKKLSKELDTLIKELDAKREPKEATPKSEEITPKPEEITPKPEEITPDEEVTPKPEETTPDEEEKDPKPSLPKGWYSIRKADYIIESNVKKRKSIENVAKRLDLIRDKYEEEFPEFKKNTSPNENTSSLPKIKIYSKHEEYLADARKASNFSTSVEKTNSFYFPYNSEVLIFYDNSRVTEFYKSLYRECFYQYIHHILGFTPSTWFNAGFGHYFSFATFKGKKCKIEEPDKTHHKKYLPLQDFIQLTHEDFNKNNSVFGQQSHQFIYFLKNSKKPEWRNILQTYFNTLLENEESEDRLKDAQEKAFKGIDFNKLDASFKKIIK